MNHHFIFVIGATGTVGSRLVGHLVAAATTLSPSGRTFK